MTELNQKVAFYVWA